MPTLRLLTAIALIVASACAKNNPTAPDPFTETTGDVVGPLLGTPKEFTAQRGGTLTATITWTNGATDLDLYATTPTCSIVTLTFLLTGQCTVLAQSTAKSGTTERISFGVTSGQALRFYVLNYSQLPETFTTTIRID